MGKIEKIAFGIIMALSILAMFLINFISQNKEYKVINSIIEETLNTEEIRMVYISPDNCVECDLQQLQMEYLIENFGLSYYYIDLKDLYKYRADEVYEKLNLEVDQSKPTIAIYRNGKLEASITGVTGVNRLYSFLNNYNLLEEQQLSLNYLTITSYVETINQGKVILAIGDYQNVYSNIFEKSMWNIAENYDVEINFIYISDLSESEGKLFESKIANFEEYDLKIPSLLIIDNQKIINAKIGYGEEIEYVEFLEENDIIS